MVGYRNAANSATEIVYTNDFLLAVLIVVAPKGRYGKVYIVNDIFFNMPNET